VTLAYAVRERSDRLELNALFSVGLRVRRGLVVAAIAGHQRLATDPRAEPTPYRVNAPRRDATTIITSNCNAATARATPLCFSASQDALSQHCNARAMKEGTALAWSRDRLVCFRLGTYHEGRSLACPEPPEMEQARQNAAVRYSALVG
jgi:hypothetical protein